MRLSSGRTGPLSHGEAHFFPGRNSGAGNIEELGPRSAPHPNKLDQAVAATPGLGEARNAVFWGPDESQVNRQKERRTDGAVLSPNYQGHYGVVGPQKPEARSKGQ